MQEIENTEEANISRIYALFDPRHEDIIMYIGKTKQPVDTRLMQHINESELGRGSRKGEWIRSILSEGVRPSIKVLVETTEDGWRLHERLQIESHLASGHPLSNSTTGGEGGKVISDETKKKMSAALIGNQRTLGYKHKEQAKIKLSLFNTGKKLSEEHKEKLRVAHKGKVISQAQRDKVSANMKGKKQPPELVAKRLAGMAKARLAKKASEALVQASLEDGFSTWQ